jgi:hypothetical protein
MKKTYERPTLIRRDSLSRITATMVINSIDVKIPEEE